jgi:hypothetical protein
VVAAAARQRVLQVADMGDAALIGHGDLAVEHQLAAAAQIRT